MHDVLFENARLYPTAGGRHAEARTRFAVDDGRITAPVHAAARRTVDLRGRLVLPGFLDCHTHALYVGDRADEQALRLAGATYAEIAAAGGGILSTVAQVRGASIEQLAAATLPRLRALLAEGVTHVEIKSGYGLDTENELKMLRAIDLLRTETPQHLTATFLGAHAIPPGEDRGSHMDRVITEMLPAVVSEKLAAAVDIYVENLAFSVADLERLAEAARAHGLRFRAHTGQFSAMGATLAAAGAGAVSCDHLEYVSDDAVQAMARHDTVAVLLPGAYYCLRETRRPPVDSFRRHGVAMAVASDLNPGSSPVVSLLTVMHMAATLFGLTADEVLAGVTTHAARTLGVVDGSGTLLPGAPADFSVWDLERPGLLTYQLGGLRPELVYVGGRQVI